MLESPAVLLNGSKTGKTRDGVTERKKFGAFGMVMSSGWNLRR